MLCLVRVWEFCSPDLDFPRAIVAGHWARSWAPVCGTEQKRQKSRWNRILSFFAHFPTLSFLRHHPIIICLLLAPLDILLLHHHPLLLRCRSLVAFPRTYSKSKRLLSSFHSLNFFHPVSCSSPPNLFRRKPAFFAGTFLIRAQTLRH